MGDKLVSRGFGNISHTASITMDYATRRTLSSVCGSMMDIGEFDPITSFANPMASDYLFPQVTMVRRIVVNKR